MSYIRHIYLRGKQADLGRIFRANADSGSETILKGKWLHHRIMTLRPPAEVKKALLTTLEKVEQSVGLEADNPDVAELKHIVVQRIANLEEAEPNPSPMTEPDSTS